MTVPRDPPYPQLKKTHTMAHAGRPWTDYKPPPAAPVWAAIEGLGRYYILVAALELDVFDTLQRLGPSSAEAVADALDAPVDHVRALLDGVVALGLLDQFTDVYELNDTAERYLVSDGPATMADLIAVAPGPHENWTRLAETVRNGRPATPIEDEPAAFYVPLVEGTFTTMFRCATRADFKIRYSAMRAPKILDLGAGGAPWAIAVLNGCADGFAVVNDLPGVIEVAAAKTLEHGVADRCELRPGNFHTIEIEPEHYDIVVLGHVCRAEGAAGARHLIERAFDALKPEGRLILADYFTDIERKLNPHAVIMGTTMMASTEKGFCYTHQEFSEWLRSAGFVDLRLVEPIGFQQSFVASKPR
ncbi:MAG: methyltransferase dimerization domain-containing protein [Acidimicrobiia bacterium]|nr:methyltransferase dimerization domain-containing protein [Acidimicrobiia bacterium]